MEVNVIKLIFAFIAFYTAVLGLLINIYQKYLPKFVLDTFFYGKYKLPGKHSNLLPTEVPKRWFKHFYVFASAWSLFFLALTTFYHLRIIDTIPESIRHFISYLSTNNKATVPVAGTILALILITLQSCKRFYETHYISVFSKTKMHIGHYLLGFNHYFGTVIAIVMESHGFTQLGNTKERFQVNDISFRMILSSLVFIWAWWNQFQSATILANLRKNKKGDIVTEAHRIPYGGLFAYVSGPHNTCEVLMYLCLSVILYENSTFHYVTAWVVTNQIENSLLSHWWYKKEFKNYPENRKAIIPFLL